MERHQGGVSATREYRDVVLKCAAHELHRAQRAVHGISHLPVIVLAPLDRVPREELLALIEDVEDADQVVPDGGRPRRFRALRAHAGRYAGHWIPGAGTACRQ
jgi:hypothetical protein